MGYKIIPLTSRESTFDCYRLHLFMRHYPCVKCFFYPFPGPDWLWVNASLTYSHNPNVCSIINSNLVFIQRTLHTIYIFWECVGGSLGNKTGDHIYVVKGFWIGTQATVIFCPDVAKIQSLKTLSHNCSPQRFPLCTHHFNNNILTDRWTDCCMLGSEL